jgi:predicted O-methyltransferase YrrM
MRGSDGSLASPATAKDAAEKRILETAQQVNPVMSVSQEDGRMIRLLTEALGAKQAVEIGTSTGYSGLWFALALRATGGKLTTFEIDSGRAAEARANFRKAGVDGLITVVEGDAHQTLKALDSPIDIVFLDADKEGYRDYLDQLLPRVRPGGLILAHNISSRGENPEYLAAVTANPQLETLPATGQMTVTLKKR